MLVEDDEIVRRNCQRVLAGARYLVDTAASLQSAKHLLADAHSAGKHYDVMVLDLVLPDGYGGELLPILELQHAPTRVIAVSAHLDADKVMELIPRRVYSIPKPVAVERLAEVIECVFDAWRAGEHRPETFCSKGRLSARESEMLLGVYAGRTDAEMARAFGCKLGTIGTLWKRVRIKTGCKTKREVLAALARWCAGDEE